MPIGPASGHPGGPLVSASGVSTIPYPATTTFTGTIQLPGQAQRLPRMDAYGPQQPYSGDHVVLFNDSDSGLLITLPSGASLPCPPGHVLDMMVEPGDTQATWTILYQNPYAVHPAEALTAAFYSAADLARGYVLPSGTLNPSTPAASIGPGALPAGVTDNNPDVFTPSTIGPGALDTDVSIGAGPESMTAQFIGLKTTVPESGIFDALGGRATVLKALASIFLGVNNYFDGTSDRYISSNPAYQLNFSRTAGWQHRMSTDVSPTAGNVITWSAFIPLVDTSGNRYADAAFVQAGTFPAGVLLPGSQVTGDIAANQVGPGALDTDVTMAGAQVTGDIAANQVGPGALDTDVTMLAAQVQTGVFGGSGSATFPGAIISGGAILDNDDSANKADTIAPQVPGGSARALNLQSWDGAAAHNVLSIGSNGFQAPASFTDGGALGHLGGQATAGAFGVPVIVAQALRVHVTATTLQTILTYTIPGTGVYRVSGALSYGNTSNEKVIYKYAFTNAAGIGDFDFMSSPSNGNFALDGTTVTILGAGATAYEVVIMPQLVHMGAGTLTVTYQDPGGAPADFVTFILERLA